MTNILRYGKFRGDKVLYPDGIGCCIWIPADDKDDSWGICFDFAFEDIDELIGMLAIIKTAETEVFHEEADNESFVS